MNADGRKQIKAQIDKAGEIIGTLETLAADEQDKFDNLSEGLQTSDKGEKLQQAADSLQTAADSIQEAIDELGNIE